MRVFVTGATGFIGRHVVAELIERGHRVVALARPSSDTSGLESSGVEIALGDMTRAETLAPAVRGADAVIHLAALLKAPWRPDFSSANVAGAANVARACAAAPRPPALVVVSSLAAGGPVAAGECRDERMVEVPVSRYGRAKLAAERAAREAGVPLTIVRPPMVFGEHDRGSLPLFRAAARGLVVAPVRRRFEVSAVHGRDLARALVSAAERGERVTGAGERPGEGVYYAGGPAIEFAELGLAVARALGREARALRMPVAVTWLVNAGAELVGRATGRSSLLSLDKYREATAGHWVCSLDKLRRDLGWEPEPLEDRLAQTAAWYRAAGWL